MAAKWVALCCLPAYYAAFTVINRQKSAHPAAVENCVVVLVDCDNTKPEILEHALRVVAQFGRVVLRRGNGNHATLANKWQEALVRLAFTPCLQYQYASGKNTADIALALDAQEALFDGRADTFCLVTSDSDFAYARTQLPDGKLGELVDMISTIGFCDDPAVARDVLGQVYDLCYGSGGMFVQSEKFIEAHGGKLGDVSIYGQEANPIFDAVGLEKPNVGLLDDDFLALVKNLPERNLAVELLERLLEGEIMSKFASNVVQQRKFSELLSGVITRYPNRSIETAQVMSELVEMAKKFRAAATRGEQLGLTEDEVRFNDALANNESAVLELADETLKKITHELTENLRKNITEDWSQRESVRATLRFMVKRILRKYKYPPDLQGSAVELVLQQADVLGESWA